MQRLFPDGPQNDMAWSRAQLELTILQALGQNSRKARDQIVFKIVDNAQRQRRQMRQIHHRQLGLGQSQRSQCSLGARQKVSPRRGQAHWPLAVIDQISVQRRFKIAQLLADSRLAKPRQRSRLCNTSRCGKRLENFKAAKGNAFGQHSKILCPVSRFVKLRCLNVKWFRQQRCLAVRRILSIQKTTAPYRTSNPPA